MTLYAFNRQQFKDLYTAVDVFLDKELEPRFDKTGF